MTKKRFAGIAALCALLALGFALPGCTPDDTPTPVEKTVTTADEFLSIANFTGAKFAGSKFTLAADVDLSGKAFLPIGTIESPFIGTFDGGGHKITGIEIRGETDADTLPEAVGLFGAVRDSVFKNFDAELKITHRLAKDGCYLGGVAGAAYGALTVENARVDLEFNNKFALDTYVNPTTKIEDVLSEAVEYAGGVFGYVNGNYSLSRVRVALRSDESWTATNASGQTLPRVGCYLGGTVGYGAGTGKITDAEVSLLSFSAAAETLYAGGIAGYLTGASVENARVSYREGKANLSAIGENAKGSVGGVVGYACDTALSDVAFETADGLAVSLAADHAGKEPFNFGGIAGYCDRSSIKTADAKFRAKFLNGTAYGGVAGVVRNSGVDGATVGGYGFDFKYNDYKTYFETEKLRVSAAVGETRGASFVKNVAASIRANTAFGAVGIEQEVDKDGNPVGEPKRPDVSIGNRVDESKLVTTVETTAPPAAALAA